MWKVLAAHVAGAALTMPVIALAGGDVRADVEAKFLMVINEPGTYRLSDNLVVVDAHTTAIEINADDVTIDLNGFSIHVPALAHSHPYPVPWSEQAMEYTPWAGRRLSSKTAAKLIQLT